MEDIQSAIIDDPQPGLDSEVWEDDGLHPSHSAQILSMLFDFLEEMGASGFSWIEDIYIIGSITTNQYRPDTDIDVHILVDLDKAVEIFNLDPEVIDHILNEKWRKIINERKELLGKTKHPLEFYFETGLSEATHSQGVYSLLSQKWLQPPVMTPLDFDPETEFTEEFEEADAIEEILNRYLIRIQDILNSVWEKRREEFAQDSPANVVFKKIQKDGYFDIGSKIDDFLETKKRKEIEELEQV